MVPNHDKHHASRTIWIVAGAILIATLGIIAWRAWQNGADDGQLVDDAQPSDVAVTDEQVEQFFVGLSALDVGSDQRAMTAFTSLSDGLAEEPAIWANLAIAQLRLNELDAAEASLSKALELHPGEPRFIYLRALIRSRSGELEQAIDDLESLTDPGVTALYLQTEILHQLGDEESHHERLAIFGKILQLRPENLLVRFERARLAAQVEDAAALEQSLRQLAEQVEDGSEQATQLFTAAQAAAAEGDFREAATQLAFLQNVSKVDPQYQQSAAELGAAGGSPGRPVRDFLAGDLPDATMADSDLELQFEVQSVSDLADGPHLFQTLLLSDEEGATHVSISGDELRIGATAVEPSPQPAADAVLPIHAVNAVDLNADYRPDIVAIGSNGLMVYIQDENGRFDHHLPSEEEQEAFEQPGRAVWPLDVEADGDLDLLISHLDGSTGSLRNNGDMTFTAMEVFQDLPAPQQFLWTDFDNDGDVDIVALTALGELLAVANERSGTFADPIPLLPDTPVVAIAASDISQDGLFEIVAMDEAGRIHRLSQQQADQPWAAEELLHWTSPADLPQAFQDHRASLFLADLDNNGGIDIIASAGTSAAVWLHDRGAGFQALDNVPEFFVTSVADIDGDGRLDLAGMTAEAGQIARTVGTKEYHWQSISARAVLTPGDGRINSLGIGGTIDLRAGRLLQTAAITSLRTHFGLGSHERAGVARIVWPNGTVQAEFDLQADQVVNVQQRLKGSCPYVFARSGDKLTFIKDFIWRSPLGLKINSQETAGITQTEDWIKIPGESLTPTRGQYELRITADLWETHFFDHISLLVVDHPQSVEVYVDERFVPNQHPELAVRAMAPPRSIDSIRDQDGLDVADRVGAVDATYVDSFALGKYQGIAEEHWVEFELDADLPVDRPLYIIGQGWVYPTDSSLNVAMSQGDNPAPQGLMFDILDAQGNWQPIGENLGFPAGKNKTVLLEIPPQAIQSGHRRFRLRTNLEIYWDYLGWTTSEPSTRLAEERVEAKRAELRYRGFSEMSPPDRRQPDLPQYDRLSGTGQRWRDLEGFYTRFGDVRELLHQVDDRYVIMNAGDEMVLTFAASEPPQDGWVRDFVLIGDGWVKDGDYNTAYSRTVHPLPSHGAAEPSGPAGSLYDDPVYLRHPSDWSRFHTRYITPRAFGRGLWPERVAERTE